jgi:quinol monooxygenase YgiN
MILVIVDFAVAPEDRDHTVGTLQAEAKVVRAMPGNMGYHLRTAPEGGGAMTLIHEWTTPEALAAYRGSDTFKAVGADLFPRMAGKPSTRIFRAEEVAA